MKKLLALLLAMCMSFSVVFTVACNDGHTHNWGDWSSNGDNTHTRVCLDDSSHTETGDCEGETVCDVCGGTISVEHVHSWGDWTSDNSSTHTRTCLLDSTHKQTENHSLFPVLGATKCSKCNYTEDNCFPEYIEPGTYNKSGAGKTEIKLVNHHGGIGSVWIEQAAERYAWLMQDKSYAAGKEGVYINIGKRTGVSTMVAQAPNQTEHIFFAEGRSFPPSWGEAGLVMSLDEIAYDTQREGGTLDSIIYEQSKAVLKGEVNGEEHYYALPHYEYYGGASYNREVFDEYGAFFADIEKCNPEYIYPYESRFGTSYFIVPDFVNEDDAVKAPGPDGIPGTEDDGLPVSFEDLVILCEFFKLGCEISPIVISGKCENYINFFISGMWAALAGQEQMKNYYALNGKVEVVTGYTNEPIMEGIDYIKKPTTEWVDMTTETGYYGNDMAAKYYAYAFCEIVHKEGYFAEKELGTNTSHLDAQKTLIYGGKATKADNSKAAILMEASYWYNESEENLCFDNYVTLTGDTHEIDLRFMALPTSYTTSQHTARLTQEEYDALSEADKLGKEVHRESALLDLGQAFCFINNNIKDNDELRNAAVDFVKFLYSESELRHFTMETGMPRSIKYDLSETQQDSMGVFYNKLWNLRNWEDGSNIVYCSPRVGASKNTVKTFLTAKATIAIVLSPPILTISTGETCFYALKDTKLESDGTYKTGTKYCFEATRISESAWVGYVHS